MVPFMAVFGQFAPWRGKLTTYGLARAGAMLGLSSNHPTTESRGTTAALAWSAFATVEAL